MGNLLASSVVGGMSVVVLALVLLPGVVKKQFSALHNVNLIVLLVLTFQWLLLSVSLASESDLRGLIGDANPAGLEFFGLDSNLEYLATLPFLLFEAFRIMFAVITPVWMTRAFVRPKRLKNKSPQKRGLNRHTRQKYFFALSSRQMCASPDAHGP